jgi:hypothetical protein
MTISVWLMCRFFCHFSGLRVAEEIEFDPLLSIHLINHSVSCPT